MCVCACIYICVCTFCVCVGVGGMVGGGHTLNRKLRGIISKKKKQMG